MLDVALLDKYWILAGGDVLRPDLLGNDLEGVAHLFLDGRAQPRPAEGASVLTGLEALFFFGIGPDVASSEDIPQSEGDALLGGKSDVIFLMQ